MIRGEKNPWPTKGGPTQPMFGKKTRPNGPHKALLDKSVAVTSPGKPSGNSQRDKRHQAPVKGW